MWLDRYMAVPFKDKGRAFDGADCFGLYLLLVTHEAKLALSDPGVSYGTNPNAVLRAIEAEIASGRWALIAEGNGAAVKSAAMPFDLVKMSAHLQAGSRVINSDLHIGCALGGGMLIHTEAPAGPQYCAMDEPDIINRVKAVYRPRILAS